LQRAGATTQVRITENGEVFNPIFRFVSRFVIGQHRSIENYLHALADATGEKVDVVNSRGQAKR
jgi:hypothetical protein